MGDVCMCMFGVRWRCSVVGGSRFVGSWWLGSSLLVCGSVVCGDVRRWW